VLLEGWRHLLRKVPVVYGIEYWSMVFPIGMYAASTFAVADILHVAALALGAQLLTYVALAIWLIVATGMVRRLRTRVRRQSAYANNRGFHEAVGKRAAQEVARLSHDL
jgi:tellurite resistance protein TehA-like permease